MSIQCGIPSAFTLNQRTPDTHLYRKRQTTNPARTYPGIQTIGALGTGQIPHDLIVATPIIMPTGLMLSKFFYCVTTAQGGAVMKVGLYSNIHANIAPDSLLVDWGAHSCAVNGTFNHTTNYFLHSDVLYWLVRWVSVANVWLSSWSSNLQTCLLGFEGAGQTVPQPGVGYKFSKVYDGILPTTFPDYAAGTRIILNNERYPYIGLRLHNI